MKKSKGYRSRTRKLLTKPPRRRGMEPLGPLLYRYVEGEQVSVQINPSVHKGMPHRRFHGKIGTILEKRGRAYIVEVRNGKQVKKIIALPNHIKPYKTTGQV
jgi:large subunit ribosomal protein L21e